MHTKEAYYNIPATITWKLHVVKSPAPIIAQQPYVPALAAEKSVKLILAASVLSLLGSVCTAQLQESDNSCPLMAVNSLYQFTKYPSKSQNKLASSPSLITSLSGGAAINPEKKIKR